MNYKFSTSSIFHMLQLTGNVEDKTVDIICSLLSADLIPFNDIYKHIKQQNYMH
jgi:hypothetical protein